jgi:OOP family OmpA-OmpF porin
MKKLNKVASLLATVALASTVTAVSAQSVDNWVSGTGLPWKNGTNELCWRDNSWTPATGLQGCDGVPVPTPAPAPMAAPAPAMTPPPAAAPAPKPVVVAAPTSEKVTFAADAFFDFDKSVLKPEGKAKLDDLTSKMSGLNLEVVIAVGHTDSIGTEAYNQALSVRRADAVKAYLVEKGIEKNRVYTEGKGEKQPVADNKTAEGRAKNRRVEIEVVGTRAK